MPEMFEDLEAVLRELPRPEFKARLRETLQPQTLIPYIVVSNPIDVIDFARDALGGEELMRSTGSAGGLHSEVRIGDARVMIGGGEALQHPPMPAMLHCFVRDVDAAHARAVALGAKELMPPRDQEYGERDSVVEDAAGNQWCLATSRSGRYKPERMRSVTMYLHPHAVHELIPFVERAFGAKLLERYDAPDGTVAHAKLQLGNSVVEMGEAHGAWQPMPAMIHLLVDDADAAFERAVAAGGKSIMPPANQPYGARMAGVEDPTGNQWFMAAPLPL